MSSEDRELALGALRVCLSNDYLRASFRRWVLTVPECVLLVAVPWAGLGAAAEKAPSELRNMRRDRYRFVVKLGGESDQANRRLNPSMLR